MSDDCAGSTADPKAEGWEPQHIDVLLRNLAALEALLMAPAPVTLVLHNPDGTTTATDRGGE